MHTQSPKSFVPALGVSWATKFYDPIVRATTREYRFKRALISQAFISDSQTILDLACGTGTLSAGIKRRFPDAKVFAIDADEHVLAKALSKTSKEGVGISRCIGHQLPFADSQFDRVFSTLFFHHLTGDEKIRTMIEIRRILKKNGILMVADYGRPADFIQKQCSSIIRLIDGTEVTRDNLSGKLPGMIVESGFSKVESVGSFRTILGTIRMLRATV